MSHLKHTPFTALASLKRKRDCQILPGGVIAVISPKSPHRAGDLGNGSWGRIDYLVKVAGFRLQRVWKF
ncbi:hypothetical protein [Prolixibacter denitrificans]|uniref:Uncharacterized protein n=1 Tax=Prolixibacter denitrificans TaxID=1541063 RepID=A0A2P8CH43_9BACT|nr:hypothetical protein [Prolixibacter denitrificans]PSK84298.1 hypothetical protein CLV93_10283 [Prolixibacter denitrificans]GET20473.1 hypothetical protein JCM18694_07190 [Prolixibacter denitrificans]